MRNPCCFTLPLLKGEARKGRLSFAEIYHEFNIQLRWKWILVSLLLGSGVVATHGRHLVASVAEVGVQAHLVRIASSVA